MESRYNFFEVYQADFCFSAKCFFFQIIYRNFAEIYLKNIQNPTL